MGSVGKFIAGAGLVAAGFALAGPLGGALGAKLAGAVLGVARLAGLTLLNSSLQSKQLGAEAVDARVQTGGPDEPERIIYGEIELAISPVGFEALNPYFYLWGSLCVGSRDGGDIEGVVHVIVNGRRLVFPAITADLIEDGHFPLTADVHPSWKDNLWYCLHLGSETQLADSELVSNIADWTVQSQGRGVAYLGVRVKFNAEVKKFSEGVDTVIALVRGRRVHDPRDDTWKFSKNPVLAARDYLLDPKHGYGLPEAKLDDVVNIVSANLCDSDPGNGRPAPMFECNGWLYVDADPNKKYENLQRILGCCRGYITYNDGKVGIRINDADAPSGIEFTDDDIFGEIELELPGSERKPNRIAVAYLNPDTDYQMSEVPVPALGAADPYLAEDGGVESSVDIALPMVINHDQAEDVGFVTLKEARAGAIRFEVGERGMLASVGDIVALTLSDFGWTSRLVRVAAIEHATNEHHVIITGLIHEADAYDLDPNSTVPGVPGTDLPDPDFVEPPSNVQVDCNAGIFYPDGTFQPRLKVTWDASPDQRLEEYIIGYRVVGAPLWLWIPPVPAGDDLEAFVDQVVVGGSYQVQVIARNDLSVSSVAVLGASCTVEVPDDTPESIDNLQGRFTCLEGITLTWNPVIAVAPPAGEPEFVWVTEIREQGAGATAEDRWALASGATLLDIETGARWNLPFDMCEKARYDLTLRRRNSFGVYSAEAPIELTLINASWPCDGTGDGQCPNLAPIDAGDRHQTPQGVGTIDGHRYTRVPIDGTGLVPGVDVISYCYDVKVGPGGTGVYDKVSADGKLGRLRSGLYASPNAGRPGSIRASSGLIRRVTKDDRLVFEVQQDTKGYAYAAIVDPRLGYDENGEIDVALPQRSRHFIQARLQYEGTASPKIGGNSRTLDEPLVEDTWKRIAPQEYFMTSPFIGVVTDPAAAGGTATGYLYFVSRLEGFSAGNSANYIVRLDGDGVVNVGRRSVGGSLVTSWNRRQQHRPVHMLVDPSGRQWVSVTDSPVFFDKDPIVSTDATHSGPWYPVFGLWNDGADNNQLSGPNIGIDIGRGWFWQIDDCSDPFASITGIGPIGFAGANYAALSRAGSQRGHSPTAAGATDHVWANWKDQFEDLYAGVAGITYKSGFSIPEWMADVPWTRLEVWDGPSWQAGRSIIDTVEVPEGIWPGDVWDYDSDGTLEEGGDLADAEGRILLDFLDADLQVISTVTPAGSSSVPGERIYANGNLLPDNCKVLQWRTQKTGAGDKWAEFDDLQANRLGSCCAFTDPIFISPDIAYVPPGPNNPLNTTSGGAQIHEGDLVSDSDSGTAEKHVARLWSDEDNRYVTAPELVDAIDEHREGATNLLQDGRDPRTVAAGVGDQSGTSYPLIDLAAVGLQAGDVVSIRFEAKVGI